MRPQHQEELYIVDNFITALCYLVENCACGSLRDEMIKDWIVLGLSNAKLSEQLQLDAELTLEKSISKAQQSQAVK